MIVLMYIFIGFSIGILIGLFPITDYIFKKTGGTIKIDVKNELTLLEISVTKEEMMKHNYILFKVEDADLSQKKHMFI